MATPRVLVVDDEPAVLALVSKAFSVRGYEVHAAASPVEALELVKAGPCFDLVVSDVIMPGMCGPQLVKEIAQMCPGSAVVMMSAHVVVEGLPPHAKFINKPFRIEDLFSIVQKALPPAGE
jgi:two-component system cell cycle sensor histidine kinase/response regulator CckA